MNAAAWCELVLTTGDQNNTGKDRYLRLVRLEPRPSAWRKDLAPSSPILLSSSLCRGQVTASLGKADNTQSHRSFVSVVLPCSAWPSAMAPPAPMLFEPNLCTGVSDGQDALKQIRIVTHMRCVSVVLPCSAWPRAVAPSSPMMLSHNLCAGVSEQHTTDTRVTHLSSFKPVSLACSRLIASSRLTDMTMEKQDNNAALAHPETEAQAVYQCCTSTFTNLPRAHEDNSEH
jgi:hypothetical protein